MKDIWFRTYVSILENVGLQKMPADIFRFFFNLQAIAKKQDEFGRLPPDASICWLTRLDSDVVDKRLEYLIDTGFIERKEGGELFISDWNSHQYTSDSDPTALDRKHRQREKLRLALNGVTRDVTQGVTPPVTRTEKRREENSSSLSDKKNSKKETKAKKQKPGEVNGEPVLQMGENKLVRLTNLEYERFLGRYGEPMTIEAVTFLDSWLYDKGKDPYNGPTHAMAMSRWVFGAVVEQRGKGGSAAAR